MMDQLTFKRENLQRLREVENSFGPSGAPLSKPGRILRGEGRLMKRGRKKWQPKAFFLFNDVLVYGSFVLNGRWHKNQKIIPLESVKLEDMEDSEEFKHQWLIRTPSKSFFVSAASHEEKKAWMEHIRECQSALLLCGNLQPGKKFAVTWMPDQAACKCMRCLRRFTTTNRRHHCRKCGFIVCNSCSRQRTVISHIHPTKQLRVCALCHLRSDDEEEEEEVHDVSCQRGDSTGNSSSGEEEVASSSDEEDVQACPSSSWMIAETGTYVCILPGHL
ncbi:pleckstrin homology domain-containing family F member 2-like [Mugil cephalus]|uniref:pleckstrin homology domain-containing family F member 2-like n=1 Tax=Mugil cephalus TaxID=48193 RepID=UPI001FB72103|nr:pleckstrin homology domain-containing family F member 2-like [Mugil cephalus]